MPEELRIPVSVPGAREAAKALADVADGERKVGAAAQEAGQKGGQAAESHGKAAKELHREVGQRGPAAFEAFKGAGVAAATAIGAAFQAVMAAIAATNERMRETYRQWATLSQAPGTAALSQLRGETEKQTTRWMLTTAKQYGLGAEQVRAAAFDIESGIQPGSVGGAKALAEIQAAAFKTMRATGASGQTVAGLTIGAYEAGVAKTPEQFRQFYGKAAGYAGLSRMNLEAFGGIMARLLPMAVSAGMSPDEFMAQAGAMSYRISDPSALATALQQMIRAAGTQSGPLKQFAGGRQLGAQEIMGFQSQYISDAMKAGGPQGATAAAGQLGLSGELVGVYAAAFDPAVRGRMAGMMKAAGGAGWGAIGQRYGAVRGTPAARVTAGQQGQQLQEFERAVGREQYMAMLEEAEEQYRRRLAAGDAGAAGQEMVEGALTGIPLVGKFFQKGMGARSELTDSMLAQLDMLARMDAGPRGRRAGELAEKIRLAPTPYVFAGADEGLMRDAAGLLSSVGAGGPVYQGGTHYHNEDRRDPAGAAQPPTVPQ